VAKRYHLDTVEKPDGTRWLTLVYEDPFTFFVELYNDSRLSFLKDRLKVIRIGELGRHEFNGLPLWELVERKLREIESSRPDQAILIASRRKRFASSRG